MRCIACDKILTESEDARTFKSGSRVQLCTADAAHIPRELLAGVDVDDEDFDDSTIPLEEEELDEDDEARSED